MKIFSTLQVRREEVFLQFTERKRRCIGGLSKFGSVAVLVLAFGGTAIAESTSWATDESGQAKAAGTVELNAKAKTKQEAFAIFKKHCVQCHNSVADPERPGKTRVEWYTIINLIMKTHGLETSQEEADIIAEFLYALRPAYGDTPGLQSWPTTP